LAKALAYDEDKACPAVFARRRRGRLRKLPEQLAQLRRMAKEYQKRAAELVPGKLRDMGG
jgi:hypothetical protein